MFILINNGDVFDGTFEQFEDNFFSFDGKSTEEEKKIDIMNWAKSYGFKCDFVTKRPLYNSDGCYTGHAGEIDHLHSEMVIGIFKKYTALGYNVREISHILMSHIPLLESRFILDMRKEARNTMAVSVDKMKAYDLGLCAGDTAFRIGGQMLYYKTDVGVMKRSRMSPLFDRVISESDTEYTTALGYIEGYTSAERSCKK